jgi:hypothetical protein
MSAAGKAFFSILSRLVCSIAGGNEALDFHIDLSIHSLFSVEGKIGTLMCWPPLEYTQEFSQPGSTRDGRVIWHWENDCLRTRTEWSEGVYCCSKRGPTQRGTKFESVVIVTSLILTRLLSLYI